MPDDPIDHAVTRDRDESLRFKGGRSPQYRTVVLETADGQQVQRTSQTRPHRQQNTLL